MNKKYDKDEMLGFLSAFDNDDLPDGAWFQMLTEGAEAFIKSKKLKLDSNDLVHEYLESVG